MTHPFTRRLLAAVALWGLAVAVLAATGAYDAIGQRLIGPRIVLGILLPFAAYCLAPGFRAGIRSLGVRPLTVFHIWRIPAAFVFFWYGAQGLLPEAFVRPAAWGDLASGLLAMAVVLAPASRGRYLAFHLFGLADLVLAVATGISLTLSGGASMDAIQTLPLALIPLFGVGISGASHLMALDMLCQRSDAIPRAV